MFSYLHIENSIGVFGRFGAILPENRHKNRYFSLLTVLFSPQIRSVEKNFCITSTRLLKECPNSFRRPRTLI